MNCGCLPGFPGENRKQLLNAIVHWEGSAGGDFETLQKWDWRLQKVVIRPWTGEDLEGCCLMYLHLFGERFYASPTFSLLWVCRDGISSSSVWGLAWVCGGSTDSTFFFFDFLSFFYSSLLFLGAVGASGFASAISYSAITNMSLSTISILSIEAIPNYPGHGCIRGW